MNKLVLMSNNQAVRKEIVASIFNNPNLREQINFDPMLTEMGQQLSKKNDMELATEYFEILDTIDLISSTMKYNNPKHRPLKTENILSDIAHDSKLVKKVIQLQNDSTGDSYQWINSKSFEKAIDKIGEILQNPDQQNTGNKSIDMLLEAHKKNNVNLGNEDELNKLFANKQDTLKKLPENTIKLIKSIQTKSSSSLIIDNLLKEFFEPSKNTDNNKNNTTAFFGKDDFFTKLPSSKRDTSTLDDLEKFFEPSKNTDNNKNEKNVSRNNTTAFFGEDDFFTESPFSKQDITNLTQEEFYLHVDDRLKYQYNTNDILKEIIHDRQDVLRLITLQGNPIQKGKPEKYNLINPKSFKIAIEHINNTLSDPLSTEEVREQMKSSVSALLNANKYMNIDLGGPKELEKLFAGKQSIKEKFDKGTLDLIKLLSVVNVEPEKKLSTQSDVDEFKESLQKIKNSFEFVNFILDYVVAAEENIKKLNERILDRSMYINQAMDSIKYTIEYNDILKNPGTYALEDKSDILNQDPNSQLVLDIIKTSESIAKKTETTISKISNYNKHYDLFKSIKHLISNVKTFVYNYYNKSNHSFSNNKKEYKSVCKHVNKELSSDHKQAQEEFSNIASEFKTLKDTVESISKVMAEVKKEKDQMINLRKTHSENNITLKENKLTSFRLPNRTTPSH